MSAWVIALGLSAGYLINKNMQMAHQIAAKVKVYNEAAAPADPGPTSQAIRNVQRTVPDADRYEDINMQDVDRERLDEITGAREAAHQEVAAYERGPPPIEGVWLNLMDRCA